MGTTLVDDKITAYLSVADIESHKWEDTKQIRG